MPPTETKMIPVTPQGITNAIQELIDENDRLKKQLGSRKPNNAKKLTPAEVKNIRAMKQRGWTNVEIAECYDVNPATVSRIVRGQYHKAVA